MQLIVYALSCSVVSDSCIPIDCSPPGSSVRGILQARILEWVAISFSRESSWPRGQTRVSCPVGRLCTHSVPAELWGKPRWLYMPTSFPETLMGWAYLWLLLIMFSWEDDHRICSWWWWPPTPPALSFPGDAEQRCWAGVKGKATQVPLWSGLCVCHFRIYCLNAAPCSVTNAILFVILVSVLIIEEDMLLFSL